MTTKKCARPGCKNRFEPTKKNPHKAYCSPTCGALCRSSDVILAAAQKTREKKARNKQQAKLRGLTPSQLFEARIEEYWQRVVDPYYYTMQRGASSQSALGGLDG